MGLFASVLSCPSPSPSPPAPARLSCRAWMAHVPHPTPSESIARVSSARRHTHNRSTTPPTPTTHVRRTQPCSVTAGSIPFPRPVTTRPAHATWHGAAPIFSDLQRPTPGSPRGTAPWRAWCGVTGRPSLSMSLCDRKCRGHDGLCGGGAGRARGSSMCRVEIHLPGVDSADMGPVPAYRRQSTSRGLASERTSMPMLSRRHRPLSCPSRARQSTGSSTVYLLGAGAFAS